MPEATAVVFDLDDTLYEERRFALSGFAAVAAHLYAGKGASPHETYRFLVRRFRAGARADGLQALCIAQGWPVADVTPLVEVIRTHAPRLRLPGRSRAVLTRLRGDGHRLGVLTNGLPSTQRGKVAALGLEPLADAVVYAEECAPGGKPARACFATVLARLGVHASAAVFVGDHLEKDIAGAAAAGLRTVWLSRGRVRPACPAPDTVARRLADVPTLVARLLRERHELAR